MNYEIISRAEAHAKGLKHFFTGKPCTKGHISRRFVTTGGCMTCNRERGSRYAVGQPTDFKWALHPDDHAAAKAYCQALDLQRSLHVAAEIHSVREAAIKEHRSAPQLFMPKP